MCGLLNNAISSSIGVIITENWIGENVEEADHKKFQLLI